MQYAGCSKSDKEGEEVEKGGDAVPFPVCLVVYSGGSVPGRAMGIRWHRTPYGILCGRRGLPPVQVGGVPPVVAHGIPCAPSSGDLIPPSQILLGTGMRQCAVRTLSHLPLVAKRQLLVPVPVLHTPHTHRVLRPGDDGKERPLHRHRGAFLPARRMACRGGALHLCQVLEHGHDDTPAGGYIL